MLLIVLLIISLIIVAIFSFMATDDLICSIKGEVKNEKRQQIEKTIFETCLAIGVIVFVILAIYTMLEQ